MPCKTLLYSLLLSLPSLLSAQAYTENIQSNFTAYWNLISEEKYEQAMDYPAPELLEITSREPVLEAMRSSSEDPVFDIATGLAKVVHIEAAQQIEGKHYALVKYLIPLKMRFKEVGGLSEENRSIRTGLLRTAFEQQFGAEQLQYDAATGFFLIESEEQLYAISENGRSDWRFLVFNKGQAEIERAILPEVLWEN